MPDPIEELLTDHLRRVEIPRGDLGAVLAGGRRRRAAKALVVTTLAGVLVGVAAWVAVFPDPEMQTPVAPTPKYTDIKTLRNVLPGPVAHLADDGLVLLYREGDDFLGYYEGLFETSCPKKQGCYFTAMKRGASLDSDVESETGSDAMVLKVPEGAQVLFSGDPPPGELIGVDSPGACDRSHRFAPLYTCVEGAMVRVATEDDRKSADSYPRLFDFRGVPVFAPGENQPWGWCPHETRRIPHRVLGDAGGVVVGAVKTWVRRGAWEKDFAAPRITDVHRGPREVFRPQRKACGEQVARRSVVVSVTYPKLARRSASLGSALFYVARVPGGWVLWDTY